MEENSSQPTPPEEHHQPPLAAKYIAIERRSPRDTVFTVDDALFHSSMPQPTHWSIAWSDLMMTMFILFLSMFVYKAANQEFLSENSFEVVAGDTASAIDSEGIRPDSLPFAPIEPGAPLITSGTVKRTEEVGLGSIDVDAAFSAPSVQTQPSALSAQSASPPQQATDPSSLGREPVQPPPLQVRPRTGLTRLAEIYRRTKGVIDRENLRSLASLNYQENSSLRLILAADLLFPTGSATLTDQASQHLRKLGTALQLTPYVLRIEGHTDNVPMFSDRFASNWDLSAAQASSIARFLIDEAGLKPQQIVVSGFASYRPVAPNTTASSRKKNRRVVIDIGRQLPVSPADYSSSQN